jgi:hypothetical protein
MDLRSRISMARNWVMVRLISPKGALVQPIDKLTGSGFFPDVIGVKEHLASGHFTYSPWRRVRRPDHCSRSSLSRPISPSLTPLRHIQFGAVGLNDTRRGLAFEQIPEDIQKGIRHLSN